LWVLYQDNFWRNLILKAEDFILIGEKIHFFVRNYLLFLMVRLLHRSTLNSDHDQATTHCLHLHNYALLHHHLNWMNCVSMQITQVAKLVFEVLINFVVLYNSWVNTLTDSAVTLDQILGIIHCIDSLTHHQK